MPTERALALKALLEQDPDNTFVRYGLAMEYANQGQLEEAIAEYGELMQRNADYVASYFHCGQALERLGRIPEAREVYEKGMAVAGRVGDEHTRSELQGVLDLLPEE